MKFAMSKQTVVSILLNHRFPNGNITELMRHVAHCWYTDGAVYLTINLPDGHWAFTHAEKPPRYEAHTDDVRKLRVYDREQRREVAVCVTEQDARWIVAQLNRCDDD